MHFFEANNGTKFNYSSDMSGDINIISKDQTSHVNGNDILQFVAEYLRRKEISKLEDMCWQEILGK